MVAFQQDKGNKFMDSIVEEIKQRLDIADIVSGYIQLHKAGQNYKACCPFHNEKTPSLMVSPSRQIWKCFGCGEGGDIFGFVMKMEGVDFVEALRILAVKAGVELKKENIKEKNEKTAAYEICELAAKFYQKYLSDSKRGQAAKKYLLDRGFSEKIIQDYRFGYAPQSWDSLKRFLLSRKYSIKDLEKSGLEVSKTIGGNVYDRFRDRIMFPIFNVHGDVVGFSGRVMPDGNEEIAKYINNPQTTIYDKGNLLYGLNVAKADIRRQNYCVLVEGNADVVSCHQHGFLNTVASCGTALTANQLKIIKRYTDNLFIAFDKDSAGAAATERCIDLALQEGMNVKIVIIPSGKDPADCLQKSKHLWENAVSSARNVMDYFFERVFSQYDAKKIEGKKEIAKLLMSKIQKLSNKIEQHYYIKKLASEIDVDEKLLRDELKSISMNTGYKKNAPLKLENKNSSNPLLENRLIGFLLLYPNYFNVVKENCKGEMFFGEKTKMYFDILKAYYAMHSEKFNIESISEKDVKEDLNMIAFEIENIFTAEDDIQKEIQICLQQLKGNFRKIKMAELIVRMKKAEEEKQDSERLAVFQEIKSLIEITK